MDSARKFTSNSREAGYSKRSIKPTFMDALSETDNDNDSVNTQISGSDSQNIAKKEEPPQLTKAKESFDEIFSSMKSYATSGSLEKKMELDYMNKLRVQCIQYLLRLLFGSSRVADSTESLAKEAINSSTGGQIGFEAVTYAYAYEHTEFEETTFSTNGKVVTKDGREIDFNLNLTMSRSFTEYYAEKVNMVNSYIDPLVINFDDSPALVSDVSIKFDLDSDGIEDKIAKLCSNSGFLALDKNEDGIINDGSELFGTSSGDGFYDLSQYDIDANGWIDEADEIFDKLRICVMDEDGNQSLYTLREKGVGAICLQNADTEFSLNSLDTNDNLAKIRKTGIFLYENGNIGTVQHLDLAQ